MSKTVKELARGACPANAHMPSVQDDAVMCACEDIERAILASREACATYFEARAFTATGEPRWWNAADIAAVILRESMPHSPRYARL